MFLLDLNQLRIWTRNMSDQIENTKNWYYVMYVTSHGICILEEG